MPNAGLAGDQSSGLAGAVAEFVDRVRSILAIEGPSDTALAQLCDCMGELLHHPAVSLEHDEFERRSEAGKGAVQYRATGRSSEVLHSDESGLTLVRSRFSATEATPIHSHSSWGVVGVYSGRDLHRSYRRRDGGTGEGFADLELLEERVLGPGDVVLIPRPPQDIHSQQGYGGESTFELVLFGANAMVIPRLVFDLEGKSARELLPGNA